MAAAFSRHSTSIIPPQERLYAGGPTTVRGFRQNELGPAVYIVDGYREVEENGETYYRADSGNIAERVVPTGGNTLVVGNVEVQVPSPFAAAPAAAGPRSRMRDDCGSARATCRSN